MARVIDHRHPDRNAHARAWVEAIIEADRTSVWEDDFLESVSRQLESGPLSEKQLDVLERIYTEKT